ncbi:MAG: tyrosine-type recombinase/integrase [Candidatus Hydrogenedentes bacterium]|nr:tyrosine-type recombinase/integrase [Candidatus Hydrogenedentota bacterium]
MWDAACSIRGAKDAAKYKDFILPLIFAKRLHDLRHTFASVAVQNGASLYEVQKLLGHSSSVMTQRYSHLSLDGLRTVTNGVAERIRQATG